MSFMVRMSILGTLLLVALCGLAWEYLVAVPGFNNAQAKLTKLSDENIKKTAEEAMTMSDIKKVLPQSPSATKIVSPSKKENENDMSMRAMFFLRHDKYNYYHALPWKKPESITVVYKRTLQSDDELDKDAKSFADNEWVFWSVHFNSDPPATAQRSVSKDAVNPGDMPTAAGGGGGGGGGGGRQRPNPDQIFKDADKNGDGKLEGDEISDRMKSGMERIDQDKDGAITLDELKASFSRGRRGGDREKGKSARPSDDDSDTKKEDKGDAKDAKAGETKAGEAKAAETKAGEAKAGEAKKAETEKKD